MKKLKFLISVPDKYTNVMYKAGEVYEFEDTRADEILKARTPVTKEPYAVENVEKPVENGSENVETVETVEKPKRKRKTKKDKE